MTTYREKLAVFAAFAMAAATTACGNPEQTLNTANKGPAAAAPKPVVDAGAPSALAPPPLPHVDFAENDFVESDRNRDPFRSYASMFAPETNKRTNTQRDLVVVLPQYSLDELRLVAIVTGGDYNRAMVIDPSGKGWVLKRGDWVGRPEIVHVGGANGTDYQINWRVDKVRDGDVVFTREDPAQPGIPPASRVIALRPEGEAKDKL